MNIDFTARQLHVDPGVRELVEKKLARLEKVLPADAKAKVVIRKEKKEVAVEVTVQARQKIWTATAAGDDQETVAREVLDRIEAQARKTTTKVKEGKKSRTAAVKSPEAWTDEAPAVAPAKAETRPPKVERVTPRPTFEEDAIHKFIKWDRQIFVYRDPSDEGLRILYRRRDGSLRILVPTA